MKRRVVVTGMGAVSPIGNTVNEMWDSVKANKCGIEEITLYDTTNHKVKLAGEVKNLIIDDFILKKNAKRMDKVTQFGVIAAKEALADSKLEVDAIDATRFGVIVSSGIGGLGTIEREHSRGMEKGFDRVSPFFIPMAISNITAGTIAINLGAKGMCSCVVTACAGGTNAIGDSFRQIRDGYLDVIACGGSEASITELGMGGFTSLKALNESTDPARASIPFDKERSGFVMGEGAGILILEELNHAQKRRANIYGEVIGYGATCDAHHITAPLADGSGAARCMIMAMEDGKIEPKDIDYINAHGTSTPLNDSGETKAIKLALGESANDVMISSTKSMTGHLLGASGAIEAIIMTKAIENNFVPATINYQVSDENCDLDIVPNIGREAIIHYAMSNSLGFGGHNGTILMKKWEDK